jgi:UDP-N-acetylmuramoyl-tripeptide--D-alanyl-D-alanine ligase
MNWTLQQAARAMGAVPSAPPAAAALNARLAGVSIDSRTVARGEIFFAVRGERHDAHKFVAAALGSGALAAVMNAIADAIPGEAGATLDMPATPLRVWQACQQLKKTRGH